VAQRHKVKSARHCTLFHLAVQVGATLECEARRTVDLRAGSSILLSAMTSEPDLIHEPKGRLVYPAMVSVAGLLGRGWASWAEHIRNPQSATSFHLEDLTGNGPREAGVFTLADVGGRVVLIRRKPQADWPGIEVYWWLPGGGREAGEGLDEAAIREFREETGLEICIGRLLLDRIKDGRFFNCWFRGCVVAGRVSPALFHCYDIQGLPRTNGDLESHFRDTQRRLLRTTGQKGQTRRALQRVGAWELLPDHRLRPDA